MGRVNTTSAPSAVMVTNTGSMPQPVHGRMNGTPGHWQDYASTKRLPRRCLPWGPAAHSTSRSRPVPQVTGAAPSLVVDGINEEEGGVNVKRHGNQLEG